MVNPNWEQFSLNDPEKMDQLEKDEGGLIDQEKPEAEKPQWGNFDTPSTHQNKPDPLEEENSFGWFIRNLAINASGLAGQVLGRYGNIEKFGKDVLVNFPQTGGVVGKAINELVGEENWEKLIRGNTGRTTLPTSEDIKGGISKATSGYTEPKTKREKEFQELTEDITASTQGRQVNIPGRSRTANFLINNAGIPAAANIVKKTVKDLGFGEDKATYTKGLTWLGLSLLSNVSASNFASNLMNEGRNGIPANLVYNTQRLINRLNQINLMTSDPRNNLALRQLNAIQNDIASGNHNNVRSLMNAYDGINAAKRDAGMFQMSRPDRAFASRQINLVRDAVREEIMQYECS